MGVQLFVSFLNHQKVITINRMAMKTTTSTNRNQKIKRKLREDIVEAVKTIRFSLQNLSMIY